MKKSDYSIILLEYKLASRKTGKIIRIFFREVMNLLVRYIIGMSVGQLMGAFLSRFMINIVTECISFPISEYICKISRELFIRYAR